MNQDAFPEQPEEAPQTEGDDDILDLAAPGETPVPETLEAAEARPMGETPVAGVRAVTPMMGAPKGPPSGEPAMEKIPPKSFLEKVASLGIFLWGLIALAALGGALFFLITFMLKYKIL